MTWPGIWGFQRRIHNFLALDFVKVIFSLKKQHLGGYRNREQEFRSYFLQHSSSSLVYCANIKGLVEALGIPYNPLEWRLFIDSSSRSLKAVLLNIGNKIASVPIGHSIQLTESYENMKKLLDAINYSSYKWRICGDLKVRSFYTWHF